MKKALLILSLALSTTSFSKEIPLPDGAVTFKNPTLNGLNFLAVDSGEYYLAEVGGTESTVADAGKRAQQLCSFLGFKNALTYSLKFVVKDGTEVLLIDEANIANPYLSYVIEGKEHPLTSSVFNKITCAK